MFTGATLAFLSGFFSDKYGRKKTCFYCALTMCLSLVLLEISQLEEVGLSIASRYAIYTIIQFVLGYTVFSLDIITFILLIECTNRKHGEKIAVINQVMYANGEVVLLVICYVARDWKIQNMSASFLAFLASLALFFIISESPR